MLFPICHKVANNHNVKCSDVEISSGSPFFLLVIVWVTLKKLDFLISVTKLKACDIVSWQIQNEFAKWKKVVRYIMKTVWI